MSGRRARHRGWLAIGIPAVLLAAVVWPPLGVGAGCAGVAWAQRSRQLATMHHRYAVPSLADLRARAGGHLWGRPGAYALTLARRHAVSGWAATLAAAAVAVAATWAGVQGRATALPLAAALVLGASAGVLAAQVRPLAAWAAAGRARAGARQEALTLGHVVAEECVAGIVCGWLPPGRVGDIDAAVVCRSGVVVVVETKTGAGALEIRAGTVFAGGRAIPGDPLAQVRAAAQAAHDALAVPVLPVVCVPRAQGVAQGPDGVWIAGGDELAAVVRWASTQTLAAPAPSATLKRMTGRRP